MSRPKEVLSIRTSPALHWVGDGFPVRSVFSYHQQGEAISPFLLLDYAEPYRFEPTQARRGVGEHPHRGFETVTIVYEGALEHADSGGNRGSIGAGDVQWMTAASGVVHEEKHTKAFAESGGMMEMAQLWVNLPAKDKMSAPGYQTILADSIPQVRLPEEGGFVRVIAGRYGETQGPAKTFTNLEVWDVRLKAGARAELPFPEGHTAAIFVLRGAVALSSAERLGAKELALFGTEGAGVMLEAQEDVTLLALGGEPIREPIAGYGPFVMNTEEEIRQAVRDYQSGKMGRL